MEIPKDYTTIINVVHEICPSARIAGGCLRDTFLRRSVKDIDVFLSMDVDIQSVANALNKLFYCYAEPSADQKEYEGSSFIAGQMRLTGKSIEINLIGVESVYNLVDKFDFGINQIEMVDGGIHWTSAFSQDVNNKTFTLTWCENQERYIRCVNRFNRLHEKYPEYTLYIPTRFRHFMEATNAKDRRDKNH